MGMSNMQLFIAAGLPTLMVLVGILLSQRSSDRLEHRSDRIEARLERIEADLREFYRTLGQHDAKIENLEKRNA
jgi:F0F1-type ATP synthase membrane subunit b/b'